MPEHDDLDLLGTITQTKTQTARMPTTQPCSSHGAAGQGPEPGFRTPQAEGDHTDLVTTGPFRVVRNPIFTAMVITSVGLALMIPSAIALAGLAALLAALLQVRVIEEPYLRRVHGSAYDHYTASVGRFIPGVGQQRS